MLFATTAYANSSWHWLTKRPFDILPYVVIGTLLIEHTIIKMINSITCSFRLFIIIFLANIASFLLPYAVWFIPDDSRIYTLEMAIKYLPTYNIGGLFVFLTLIVEIPIVYVSVKRFVTDKKRLLVSIITVNIVTTIMAAVVERVFCKGSW